MNTPLLDSLERNSSAWLKLKDHLEKRLDALRRQNDVTRSADATEKLRGRIAEIKEILALAEEQAPEHEAEDDEHLC